MQKLKDVSDILREEICSMTSAFSKWPPSEQEITTKNASTPTLLRFFLENLLYSSDKQTHRRNRIISSIAQDLIYNATGGEFKTVNYVELGLCTKRKAGSKKLITRLNRLGDSTSYHDVNLVETHIAEEPIANVTTAAYVPNNIRTEEFVTFVHDNGDINFELVYGSSYHCTNAIAIQQKPTNRPEQIAAPATVTSNCKKRSFKPISNPVEPAVKIPRSDSQLVYNSEVENNMMYEALAKLRTFSGVSCNLKHLPIIKIKPFRDGLVFLQQHLTDLKMLVMLPFSLQLTRLQQN